MISSPEVHRDSGLRADLDRLGDEIAELSAHLDAATAQLWNLIRDSTPATAGTPAFARAPRGCRGASGSTPVPPASRPRGARPRLPAALGPRPRPR